MLELDSHEQWKLQGQLLVTLWGSHVGLLLRRARQSLANQTAKGIAPADGLCLDVSAKWGLVSDSDGGSVQVFDLPE